MMRACVFLKWSFLLLLLICAIVVPFLIWGDIIESSILTLQGQIDGATAFGVVIALVLSIDVFLPVPSSLIMVLSGATIGLFWSTAFCWLGLSIGSILGYAFGRGLAPSLLPRLFDKAELENAQSVTDKVGFLALISTRAIPVLAETMVIAAGAVSYSFPRFLIACLPANLGLAFIYSLVGNLALGASSFVFVFLATMLPPLCIHIALRIFKTPQASG